MLLIITISTFICISLVLMGIYWLVVRPQSAATERLKKLGQRSTPAAAISLAAEGDGAVADLAGRVLTPIDRLVPRSASEVKKLQKQLQQAGIRSNDAPMIFRGLHLCSMI